MLTENLKDVGILVANTIMEREGLLTQNWSYDYGVVWRGMEMLYELTGDERYFHYIKDAMDTYVSEDGTIRGYNQDALNLDFICDGRQLLYLAKKTGDRKYALAADTLREQLRLQPRTTDGGFWHKKCYPWQMWLDGLHMSGPFYMEYAVTHGEDQQTIDDAARQFILAYEHTLDEKDGLLHHAWDEKHEQFWADPDTGRAAHAWGRAVGWYMAGMVDLMEWMPKDCASFAQVRDIFDKVAARMLAVRDEGVWLQVLDCPGRVGNYHESSGSCLMVYAILKAARLGFVPEAYGRAAQESYGEILRHFIGRLRTGEVFVAKCCRGAGLGTGRNRDGSFDYYISEPITSFDLKATGAFIQAACEMERVNQ